jgi:hypothetical protein
LSASGNDFGTIPWLDQGHFEVYFSNDQYDFAFEYAFLLDGALTDAGTGSLSWDAAAGAWNWSNDFTATIPTPIGGTVWLLASGLLAVAEIRRRKRSIPDSRPALLPMTLQAACYRAVFLSVPLLLPDDLARHPA